MPFPIDWAKHAVCKPLFVGVKSFTDYPLDRLVNFIDWTPFFSTWELSGHYPEILEDPIVGDEC